MLYIEHTPLFNGQYKYPDIEIDIIALLCLMYNITGNFDGSRDCLLYTGFTVICSKQIFVPLQLNINNKIYYLLYIIGLYFFYR